MAQVLQHDLDYAQCEIERKAQEALAGSAFYELRDLVVQREGNSLAIYGRTISFYHKQQAQELVRSVAGDLPVVNLIIVDLKTAGPGPVGLEQAARYPRLAR